MNIVLNIVLVCAAVDQLNGFPTSNFRKTRPIEDPNLFEGDIVLPKRSTLVRGVARRGNSVAWTNGIVPYEISSEFESEQKFFLLDIMRKMEHEIAINNTKCIQFRPRISSDQYYIVIKDGPGTCSSSVGQNTDIRMERTVTLSYPECFTQPLVMHELLHVLGFYHEQSRPDRDNYVEIIDENIEPSMRLNFAKYDHTYADTQSTPYDYQSLLHYDSYTFTSNGYPTILPRDPNVILQRRFDMSPIDIEEVRLFYKCSATGLTLTTPSSIHTNKTITSSLTKTSLTFDRQGFGENEYYYYEAYEVRVSRDDYYTFVSRASIDTYGYFYKDEFYSNDVHKNLMEMDDDGNEYPDFKIYTFLETGTRYILVVTTQKKLVTGDYQIIALNSPSIEIKKLSEIPILTTLYPDIISKYSSELTMNSPEFAPSDDPDEIHYYEAIIITISQDGEYTFESDTTVHSVGCLYMTQFDPFDSERNLLHCDHGIVEDEQFFLSNHLSTNKKYILLMTTFNEYEIGKFSILAAGPGSVKFSRIAN